MTTGRNQSPRLTLHAAITTVLAIVLTSGCSAGQPVTPDVLPILTPAQGLLVLAADSNRPASLTLCRDADFDHCVDFGPLTQQERLQISQVQAGSYCLMSYLVEALYETMAFGAQIEAENARCFEVMPGTLTYPGHFVMRIGSTNQSGGGGWAVRDSIRGEIDRAFPKLAGMRLHVAAWK